MFAQITSIRTPLGGMDSLREMVVSAYLPLVRTQSGYLRAYFLEQVDDFDQAELIVVWTSHADYEQFRGSEAAEHVYQALRALALRIERQGYLVRVAPPTPGT